MRHFANKNEAVQWAKALLERDFLIVDFETVGRPDYKGDYFPEPCQIAIIDQAGVTILNTLIKPRSAIHPDAQKIHGISQLDVKNAPRWPELYDHLKEWLHDKDVVAYNAAFEEPVLNSVNNLYTLPLFTPRWHCAMKAYAAFREIENAWSDGFKWHKLSDAVEFHGIKSAGAHDAANDCRFTLDLIKVMANGGGHSSLEQLRDHLNDSE